MTQLGPGGDEKGHIKEVLMAIFAQLFVAVCAGISMSVIVSRYNARCSDALAYIEPISSGVVTSLFAVVAAPYFFYKMHGMVGIAYGFAFVVGMAMSATLLMTVLSFIGALMTGAPAYDAAVFFGG